MTVFCSGRNMKRKLIQILIKINIKKHLRFQLVVEQVYEKTRWSLVSFLITKKVCFRERKMRRNSNKVNAEKKQKMKLKENYFSRKADSVPAKEMKRKAKDYLYISSVF